MSVLIQFQKKIIHELGLENMTLKGVLFQKCKNKTKTFIAIDDNFLDLPLAIYLLPEISTPRTNSPSLSPCSWAWIILYSYLSLFSHTVWVLKALGSDQ